MKRKAIIAAKTPQPHPDPTVSPLWPLAALAFVSSVCLMTIEVVAGRLIAPYAGVSLYTWTSVIGVVLAGMSIGGYAGGWLADRVEPRRCLGWLLLASALAAGASVLLAPVAAPLFGGIDQSPVTGVLFPVALIFLAPSACMAAISPVTYKLAVQDLKQAGGVAGRLAAAGALGSIVGTLGTGFWLIPWFGTRAIILGVAAVLAVLGLIYGGWRRRWASSVTVLALLLALTAGTAAEGARGPCDRETEYYCIQVQEGTAGEIPVRAMKLDHLIHSVVDLNDPTHLLYEYEKIYDWVIRGWRTTTAPPSAFFIGGGGYTFPRYLELTYPGSRVDVGEIDPAVTEVALREFVGGPTSIRTFTGDARLTLRDLPEGQKYDLVFGDAYHGLSVPYHLTTLEFARLLRQRLQPDGLYIANVVDAPRGRLIGAFAATLREAFGYAYVIPTANLESTSPYITQVVVASARPLNWERWPAPSADMRLTPRPWEGPPAPYLLTDDHAPVDNLLWQGIVARRGGTAKQ